MVLLNAGPVMAAVPVVHCRPRADLLGPDSSSVNHIRIRMRARRIDDYLPRCVLANFVAGDANGRTRIREMGARWYVGVFTCTYRYHPGSHVDVTVISTTCVHRGRYASTIWFDSYA